MIDTLDALHFLANDGVNACHPSSTVKLRTQLGSAHVAACNTDASIGLRFRGRESGGFVVMRRPQTKKTGCLPEGLDDPSENDCFLGDLGQTFVNYQMLHIYLS
jgi:hypothetical protein